MGEGVIPLKRCLEAGSDNVEVLIKDSMGKPAGELHFKLQFVKA